MHSDCEKRAQDAGYRPVGANSVAPKQAANPTSIRVDWPQGWLEQPLTQTMVNNGLIAYGADKTKDLASQVSVVSADGVYDMIAYASSRRANQLGRLKNSQGSEITTTTVNDRDAFRFEVSGQLESGTPISYLVTIIRGKTQIVYVTAWAVTPNYQPNKEALAEISTKVAGIL